MVKDLKAQVDLDYCAIFDASLDANIISRPEDGQIIAVNDAAIKRYGYSREEFLQMRILDLAAPELRAAVPQTIKDIQKSGKTIEWRHRCKDGRLIDVEISAQPFLFQGAPAILGSIRDISARKALESELQIKQHLLESISGTEPGTIYVFDLVKRQSNYVNHYWLDSYGYTREESRVLVANLEQLIHPEDYPGVAKSFEDWKSATPGEVREVEYRIRDKQGNWHWFHVRETPFKFDQHGLVNQVLGLAYDITKDKEVELQRQMFVSLVENSKEFIGLADLNFTPFYANPSTLKLLGIEDLESLQKLGLQDIYFPEDVDYMIGEFLPGVLEKGNDEIEVRFRQVVTGEAIWVLYNVFALHDASGKASGWATVSRDITERKFAEVLLESQKQILEMIAAGAPLAETLSALILCIERQSPGMLGSVLLLDDDGIHIRHGAAPSLPDEYNALLNGLAIGPKAGSCGTAAWRKEPVYVEDIHTDPLWEDYKALVEPFGLRACWSTPLIDKAGKVLGTFAIYFRKPSLPDKKHAQLIEASTQVASIAIARHQEEEVVKLSEIRYRLLFEHAPDGILIATPDLKYIDANASACEMFGYSLDEITTLQVSDLVNSDELERLEPAVASVSPNSKYRDEWDFRRKDGSFFAAEVIATSMPDGNLMAMIRDITERKKSEERITYLANYDALTGLPNRSLLDTHLQYALSQQKRSKGQLALMFIDIDRFKDINDTLGHSIGDAYLIEVANRLRGILREQDTAARLGGDEFILMLPNTTSAGASNVAQKILEVVAQPCRIEQHDLVVTTSIGIAMYPDDGEDLEALSKSADTAMYRAKQEGRNGYRFFTSEMQSRAVRNMHLVNALRGALELDQLQVHFQPQVSLLDGHIIGAEALLRWHHPELGDISPAEFIPIAEDSGLILPIGEWVLRTALQHLKQWSNQGHPELVMAVNLSAIQFRHPSLPELVTRILAEEQVAAQNLELELTEGVAMHDPQAAIAIMNKLFDLGVRMSIDDFGTGYSSLNYLKKFKIYKLKIDQSFVRDINTDQEDKAIVAAIISMAKNLGLQTIAEGVETAEQLEYLRAQGCDEAQGYYYSEPLAADSFEQLMQRCNGGALTSAAVRAH